MRDLRTPNLAPGARFMLAAVALALFGLLSMHGWGSHTPGHTMAPVPVPVPVPSTVMMDAGHAARSQTAVMDDQASQADEGKSRGAASTGGGETPGGDHGASLLGLCLAVITALLVGIALLLARRSGRIPRLLLPTWPHSVLIGRDRDPPDRLQLCVIRC